VKYRISVPVVLIATLLRASKDSRNPLTQVPVKADFVASVFEALPLMHKTGHLYPKRQHSLNKFNLFLLNNLKSNLFFLYHVLCVVKKNLNLLC